MLDTVVTSLKNELGERFIALVLFGSRARGDFSEDSDWDILLIAGDLPQSPYRRHMFLKNILPQDWRGNTSLFAKTPEEFEAALPALYLDIALDGIVIYDTKDYVQMKMNDIKSLIQQKGLNRVKVGRDFAWHWREFPGFNWSIEWDRSSG